ncbi:MAG: DUF4433 domain-containing protein [Anaerolineales bacterium]|nr:DUF4433 domain-containing protein [Anaerolineales bacterium]
MTAIFHITHLANLSNIIRDGGLWCDRESRERGAAQVCIAHRHIKNRRSQKAVDCGPGGTLDDYIPFYFAPRAPMLFSIHHGNVQGYHGGQAAVLHLVTSTERVAEAGLDFTFTDGHAEMAISRFFTDLQDLEKIDWEIMRSKYWHDTDQDGDRKRRRQAEFLVHHFFPLRLIESIGVISQSVGNQVMGLLQPVPEKSPITVHRDWYYD